MGTLPKIGPLLSKLKSNLLTYFQVDGTMFWVLLLFSQLFKCVVVYYTASTNLYRSSSSWTFQLLHLCNWYKRLEEETWGGDLRRKLEEETWGDLRRLEETRGDLRWLEVTWGDLKWLRWLSWHWCDWGNKWYNWGN